MRLAERLVRVLVISSAVEGSGEDAGAVRVSGIVWRIWMLRSSVVRC